MTRRKPPVHSAWTTPDGLTPCCGEDPRTVGDLTLDHDAVTCAALPDAQVADPTLTDVVAAKADQA